MKHYLTKPAIFNRCHKFWRRRCIVYKIFKWKTDFYEKIQAYNFNIQQHKDDYKNVVGVTHVWQKTNLICKVCNWMKSSQQLYLHGEIEC